MQYKNMQAVINGLLKRLAPKIEPGNLIKDAGSEDESAYILREGADGAWVRIENIDVRIRRTDEGVVVDLYPANQPNLEPVASTYAHFAECADDQS